VETNKRKWVLNSIFWGSKEIDGLDHERYLEGDPSIIRVLQSWFKLKFKSDGCQRIKLLANFTTQACDFHHGKRNRWLIDLNIETTICFQGISSIIKKDIISLKGVRPQGKRNGAYNIGN
jgi:hypothetical protein